MNSRLYWNTAIVAISLATTALTCFAQQTRTTTGSRAQKNPPITVYTTPTSQVYSVNGSTANGQAIASLYSASEEKRVDLDLNKASLKDALKQLFEQAKYSFTIEGDAPDAAITVHAKNVRFSTALGLVTDAAGVSWKMEQKDKETHFTVGKSIKPSSFWYNTPWVANGKSSLSFSNNKPLTFSTDNMSLTTPFLYRSTNPTKSGNYDLFTTLTSERQSTFICPHCKGQTTVVRSSQQPKCPKCSRTFQTDWQFCPFDSSKRPPTPGAWKYCPLCGKEVNMEEEPKRKTELWRRHGSNGQSEQFTVLYPSSDTGAVYPCGSTYEIYNLRSHRHTLSGSCCPFWNRL